MSLVPAVPHTKRKSRRLWYLLSIVLAAAGIVVFWQRDKRPDRSSETATDANARGVGYLERYDKIEANGRTAFENASEQFEEAMKLRPDWVTPKINYGMSLFFTGKDEKIDRAIQVFLGVLEADPRNPYANHCLGIIYFFRSDAETANRYFRTVTEVDPTDAYAWYFRGFTIANREESDEAKDCFEKAIKLDPYLTTARFSLFAHVSINDPKVREKMLDEITALRSAFWERLADTKPSKLGKYGTPIGDGIAEPEPYAATAVAFDTDGGIRVTLETNTTWAAQVEGPVRLLRERFGGTILRLDYDRDDRPDLLLLSAVTRNGRLEDLLLHNEGGGRFLDVTTKLGIAGNSSLGAAAADFDNSGFVDLILTTDRGVKLYRSAGGNEFEDVTVVAGLGELKGQFLTASWTDLDQDGDLDLLLAKYEEGAGRQNGQLVTFTNVGEAAAAPPNQAPPPLGVKFLRFEHPAFVVNGPVVGLVISDLDNDGDVDLIVLVDQQTPVVILNDRLLRFHRGTPIHGAPGRWTGGLVLDGNGDEQSDLVFLSRDAKPTISMTLTDRVGTDTVGRFATANVDSPNLIQGHSIDLDHDGRTDVVGLSADRKPIFLRGDRTRTLAAASFGTKPEAVPDVLAAVGCDLDRDCRTDLLLWSAGEGLIGFQNTGDRNRGLSIEPSGKREKEAARTNRDAIGAKVTAYTGRLHTLIENTTLGAGLGQSRLPLDFGIGKAAAATALRIAWPDGVPQAEVDVPGCETQRIAETDRRASSCPVLFTWDGTKYRYVTDLLGAGSMGELGTDGRTRPPRPEESVKIESAQLKSRDGRYLIKLAEPMDEILYLDHVRLDVVDHPADRVVHPDERFATAEPQPTQRILSFRSLVSPARAVDHRGQDVTDLVTARDQRTVDGFRKRSWHGFAEDHFVELEFGDRLAALAADARLFLVLAGWTDYAYPETIFGANQAGVAMRVPVLEKRTTAGTWETVGEIGFPAGLPRVMTSPVQGLAGSPACRLRIRTNMHVYWDQIQLGVAEAVVPEPIQLPVAAARLDRRGFAKEVFPTGKPPAEYDDLRLEPVTFSRWQGKVTRLGNVTELLARLDDRFVICGPGDEIVVEFDATRLPPVPSGHVRSFVLRSHGYCKDAAPFTATAGEIGPLPFRAMSNFPDGARALTGAPKFQRDYDRDWNTRSVGTR